MATPKSGRKGGVAGKLVADVSDVTSQFVSYNVPRKLELHIYFLTTSLFRARPKVRRP
jgi:hypothetical protein